MSRDIFDAVKHRQPIGVTLMTLQEAVISRYTICGCGLTWEPMERVGEVLCQCERE